MPPLLQAPSEEILGLARALMSDPSGTPSTHDATLGLAVRHVAHDLDDYDRELFDRVEAGSPARLALEAAVAQRIALEALRFAADASESTPGHDEADPD